MEGNVNECMYSITPTYIRIYPNKCTYVYVCTYYICTIYMAIQKYLCVYVRIHMYAAVCPPICTCKYPNDIKNHVCMYVCECTHWLYAHMNVLCFMHI